MIVQPTEHTQLELQALCQELDRFVRQGLGVSFEDVHGTTRGPPDVVAARHVWLYLVHTQLKGSLSRTAAAVGRDRRHIAYAVTRVDERREDDPDFDRMLSLYQATAERLASTTRQRLSLWPAAQSCTEEAHDDP